jgi:hypothetical protein
MFIMGACLGQHANNQQERFEILLARAVIPDGVLYQTS